MSIQLKKVQGVNMIFLTVLFLLSGTLCTSAVDTSIETPYKGVTLVVASEDGPPYLDYWKEFLPEFERRTGIKVEVDVIPITELYTKLATEFMAETGAYDVTQVDYSSYPMFVENNWLEPLGKYFEQGLAAPGYDLDDFTFTGDMYYEGKLITLPVMASCKTLFYRKDLFRKAGIEGPPETYSEEIEYARKLNNPPVYGVVFHGKHYSGTVSLINTMIWSCGGDFFDENWNPIFDQEPGVKALTFYCDLIKYAPPDILAYGWLEVGSVFSQGNAAMCHLYPESTPEFIDPEKSRIIGKWDMALTAHRKGYRTIPGGGGEGFQVAAQSKHKKAAFKLIEFLTSKEIELKAALAGINGNPCRGTTLDNPKYLEIAWWSPVTREGLKRVRLARLFGAKPEVDDQLLTAWDQAAIGKKSPRKALSDAADEVRKILKRAGLLK